MSERKMLMKEVTSLDLDGTLVKEMIKQLNSLIEMYGDDDIVISQKSYRHNDGYYYAVMKPTPETDEEMELRIACEWEEKRIQNMRDRKAYELLKAKFEKS